MTIYTKTGDKGLCSLASGDRVSKASLRIEAYGTVDELNSQLGVCRSLALQLKEPSGELLAGWLAAIQNDLFVVGSDLATLIEKRWDGMRLVGEYETQVLEKLIDKCQSEVAPLSRFVLPGGSVLVASLHVARTVCRRAERVTVALEERESINERLIPFLNRLSDLLFVLARWSLAHLNQNELFWEKDEGVRTLHI